MQDVEDHRSPPETSGTAARPRHWIARCVRMPCQERLTCGARRRRPCPPGWRLPVDGGRNAEEVESWWATSPCYFCQIGVTALVLMLRWYLLRAVFLTLAEGPAASVCGGAGPSAACMPESAADEHDRRHGPRPGSVPPSPPPPPVIQTGADAKRAARRGALAGSRAEQTNGLSSVYHPMSVTATMFGNSRGNICASPKGLAARRRKPGQAAKTGGMRGKG